MDDEIDLQPTDPTAEGTGARRTPILVAAAVVVALAATGAIVWSQTRGSDDAGLRTVTRDEPTPDDDGDDGPAADEGPAGLLRIRLEEVSGVFIEGFEIGLRIETGDGTVVRSTLWSDFVTSLGEPDIEAYYESVLEQAVPAGPIVVLAEANVGAGPPPSVPDIAGPLPCRVELDVAPGATELLEVSFDGSTNCIRRVDPDAPQTTTTQPPPPPTTIPTPETVVAGSSWYVDVDLQCQAFDLAGTWVLDQGDLSTWQPTGGRHEGGMFTLDAADHGTFVGDAQGVKTATFRRLGADETFPCAPTPR